MKGTIAASDLRTALPGLFSRIGQCEEELNALDAVLGDGDLGTTLVSVAAAISPRISALPDDFGGALTEIARAIGTVSGSSFSGLLMVGLFGAAALTRGKKELPLSEVGQVLRGSLEAMAKRGGARLGDKTMLDGLAAIADALPDGSPQQALVEAIEAFREKPSRAGRARLAAERSVGQDDPGMVALLRMIEGLDSVF